MAYGQAKNGWKRAERQELMAYGWKREASLVKRISSESLRDARYEERRRTGRRTGGAAGHSSEHWGFQREDDGIASRNEATDG